MADFLPDEQLDELDAPPLITGELLGDALPDLLRHLWSRKQPLRLQVISDTQRYEVICSGGTPVDAAATELDPPPTARAPKRLLGSQAMRALMTEEHGTFVVDQNLPLLDRRNLLLSGEELLMDIARQDDEQQPDPKTAQEEADAWLLKQTWFEGPPVPEQTTRFQAEADMLLFEEALQMFVSSRSRYRISRPEGDVVLEDNVVIRAQLGEETGRPAFLRLMRLPPSRVQVERLEEKGGPVLGRLEQLLLAVIMAGYAPDAQDAPGDDALLLH